MLLNMYYLLTTLHIYVIDQPRFSTFLKQPQHFDNPFAKVAIKSLQIIMIIIILKLK